MKGDPFLLLERCSLTLSGKSIYIVGECKLWRVIWMQDMRISIMRLI